jgi:hypothetical protein
MFLTPVTYGWKNPDRSQKEKTFTSKSGEAQPFVAESDDRLQPKKAKGYENVSFGGPHDANNRRRNHSHIQFAEDANHRRQAYHRFASYPVRICHSKGSADKRDHCGQCD